MNIYFEPVSNGGNGRGQYNIGYRPYLLPRQKCLQKMMYGEEFDLFGKRHLFQYAIPCNSIMIPDNELPMDFVYSFKHGLDHIVRICTYDEYVHHHNDIPTKQNILDAISQTEMYTRSDIVYSRKRYRDVYGKDYRKYKKTMTP